MREETSKRYWIIPGRGIVRLPLAERLALLSRKEDDCIVWHGYRNKDGYGRLRAGRKQYLVHRVAYELAKGPIPDGLSIDHLCRNRPCINPDHLEAVTVAENTRRANLLLSPDGVRLCKHGHPLSGDNLDHARFRRNGKRSCMTCARRHRRNHYAKMSKMGA